MEKEEPQALDPELRVDYFQVHLGCSIAWAGQI